MFGTSGNCSATNSVVRIVAQMLLTTAGLFLSADQSLGQIAQPANRVFVADVYVEGLKRLPMKKVMHCLHTMRGQEYSEGVTREDISRLAASKLCKPVDVRAQPSTDGRVNVILVVREYASVVREVVYNHNKHVD